MRKIRILIFFTCWTSACFGKAFEQAAIEDSNEASETTTDFEPQVHLPGFKFQRSGIPNPDYHKEVFLGSEVQTAFVVDTPKASQMEHLKEIFNKVDEDLDQLLSLSELASWILTSARYHVTASEQDTEEKFKVADRDGNGLVSWQEYLSLLTNRHDEKSEDTQANNEDDTDEEMKKLIDLKEAWTKLETEKDSLNQRQFHMFLHPESSESVELVVNNVMQQKDLDGDGRLSIPEYVFENLKGEPQPQYITNNKMMEFKEFVDRNQDLYVTPEELAEFLKVDSESNAAYEAQEMLWVADTNGDSYLNMDEILYNSRYFTGSKLCNYENLDHQEL